MNSLGHRDGVNNPFLASEHANLDEACLPPEINACSELVYLQPQRRLANTLMADRCVIAVREGTLAIDAILPRGRRQILDFLLPGDVVSTCALLSSTNVSIRAITKSSLICSRERTNAPIDWLSEQWAHLFARSQAQLARANVHRVMIGHLDTESRVASFLLALALRSDNPCRPERQLALPMSREDIADYLAMNPDTLSRIMMRFEGLALITRVNRRAIRVESVDGLKGLTPIAGLLSAVFVRPIAEMAPISLV
jgi:CRP/FNR family transcriptional regulator, anaerobic regulatory protein